MTRLPPVGWADAATKDDLRQLEARLELRMDARVDGQDARFAQMDARLSQVESQVDRSLRDQTRTLVLGLVGALFAMTSLCLGAMRLAG
jgi:hypothetical protein